MFSKIKNLGFYNVTLEKIDGEAWIKATKKEQIGRWNYILYFQSTCETGENKMKNIHYLMNQLKEDYNNFLSLSIDAKREYAKNNGYKFD
jgi:hypothetical protein